MRIPFAVTLFPLLGILACGGGGSDGPANTTPNAVAASIVLTPSSSGAMVSLGETRSYTVSVRDANQSVISGAPVSYTSSNGSVATVSGNGSSATVTATGNGNATITATSGTATATADVSVAQRVASVTASPLLVVMGGVGQLQAIARDARGNLVGGTNVFTFTTVTPSVAVVSSTGAVTGIAPGNTNVQLSLTRDGTTTTGNALVSVNAPVSSASTATVNATTNSTFDPSTVTIETGGSVTFSFASLTHNVIFQTVGAPNDIDNSTSQSVARTFPNPGTYPYVCTLHGGMSGTVIVSTSGALARMTGSAVKPAASGSTGSGAVALSANATTINYVITFQGLSGAPVSAHIHGPSGSSAVGDIIVNLSTAGATSGTGVITGNFTAASIIGANAQQPISLSELLSMMLAGNAYVDIHTAQSAGGEIRGQIGPP